MIPEWIFTRATVVTLAIVGAVISVVASSLKLRGSISDERVKQINRVGYGFMWVSVALFIIAGFRSNV